MFAHTIKIWTDRSQEESTGGDALSLDHVPRDTHALSLILFCLSSLSSVSWNHLIKPTSDR